MRRLLPSNTHPVRQALLGLLALALAFSAYLAQEGRVVQARAHQQESLALAALLRQSSDELTRLARLQVMRGEPQFRQAYHRILAIREGRAPWPEGPQGLDGFVLLRDGGRALGQAKPLLERLREAGFTPTELAQLQQAKAHSDALTAREFAAMEQALTAPKPRGRAAPLRCRVRAGQGRHPHAHPGRAGLGAGAYRSRFGAGRAPRSRGTRAVFVALGLVLAVLLLRAQSGLRRLLGGAVQEVHARISQIGRGDFGALPPAHPPLPDTVLGHLLRMQQQLQQHDAERTQAHQRLQLAAGVFTHAREGIMITDAQGLIVDVNEAFMRLTGYSRAELLGRSPRLLDSDRHAPEYYQRIWQDLQQQDQWQGEIWDKRKDGQLFASLQTVSTVRNAQGEVSHYISLMTDITALKEQAQRLEHIAHYDALTALPNRLLLGDRLKHAMARAPRLSHLIAIVYLDLDGFKQVNDQHGHEVGDRLLVELAARLRQVLREGDTLGRLGGDEFVAVLLDLPDRASCEPLLTRMLRELAQPFVIDGQSLQVSGSLGVTHYPQAEEVDADQLMRQADQAMYQAKLAGKNRFKVFDAK